MNAYVPWDSSYLATFLTHIKNAIGASTSIGILILAAVFAITLVTTIVRRFSR